MMELEDYVLVKREEDIDHQRELEEYLGSEKQKEDIRLRRQVPIAVETLLRVKAERTGGDIEEGIEFPLRPDPRYPELRQTLVMRTSFPAHIEGADLPAELELVLTDGEKTTSYPLGMTTMNSDTTNYDEYGLPRDFGLVVSDARSVAEGHTEYEPAALPQVEKMMGILREAALLSDIEI